VQTATLTAQTAAALAALVQSGQVSAVDVLSAHLERIDAVDSSVGAFQIVCRDRAIAEAAALMNRPDRHLLPLAGVPVAIKDNVPVEGEPMRVGSLATPERPSAADHETVRRLRAAGAIVVGLTRVPELCVWGTTDGAFGVTRNPWNPRRTAGGSSGGSAAAVAAGMAPIALGADGMGSIRIPAASCGVFGLKPGPGVVPAGLGVSSWNGMAENGPLATTVDDGALMLSALAARPDLARPQVPGALRVAVSTQPPVSGTRLDRELAEAVRSTAQRLADAGHRVEHADPPNPPLRIVSGIFAHWFVGAAEEAAALDTHRLERRTRTHVRIGAFAERRGLVRPADREAWRQMNDAFFGRFDLLVTPVIASSPIEADGWSRRGWLANVYANVRFAPFTGGWNFAGYPAASVPAGRHSNGLPLSVQIVGSRGREGLILSLARQLEMLQPWPRHALSHHFDNA
jgi:amidase